MIRPVWEAGVFGVRTDEERVAEVVPDRSLILQVTRSDTAVSVRGLVILGRRG